MTKKGAKQPSKKIEQPEEKEEQKFTLYNLLDLEKGPNSTTDQIKKQYRKLVFKYHPDKNQGDDTARQKFQKLKEAYDILTDPQKRKLYDETGSMGDDFNENAFQSAYQYFRQIYKKIEKEDIDSFAKQYRYGPMQEQDLLQYYESHQGNMTTLLECIPLSLNSDIERFIEFFETKIDQKSIKKYKSFEKTKDSVRPLKDETEQFEEMEKQQKKNSEMDALVLAIRNKSNNSFLDSLQQKYAQPKKQKIEKSPNVKAKRIKRAKK